MSTLRRRVSRAAARIIDAEPIASVLRGLEAADRGARGVFGVLTFHRIGDPGTVIGHPGLVSATPAGFADQMAYVVRRFHAISLAELMDARHNGQPLPARAVLVTFDDAYRDFADLAWPIMRAHGVPATLFVPTAFPDRGDRWLWWDWLHAAISGARPGSTVTIGDETIHLGVGAERAVVGARLRERLKRQRHDDLLADVASIGDQLGCPPPPNPVLGWDELRSLATDGVALAPHTRTHALLDRVGETQLVEELTGSQADLEREVGGIHRAIAYPSGSTSPTVRAATERAGYDLAFTTRRGLNVAGHSDWLSLRRINVGQTSSVSVLRAQLGRWALAWSR